MKKANFLNALATVAYCFCAVIFIIWASILVAFCLGYYTPKTVYAEDIAIESEDNPRIEYINNQPVLRLNGITESDNPNVLVDATFIVKGKTTPKTDEDGNIIDDNEVTETKIYLSSTNEDVVTVPKEAKLNEPIAITVAKNADGTNKGGFCFINIKNEQGLFMKSPLCIFVDIPVTELEIKSTNMQTEGIDGETKYYIYESETGNISTNFLPANSKDPTHLDNNSSFAKFRRNAKTVEYYFDEESAKDVVSIDASGKITALKVGETKIWARALKTYDDIDFVNNYVPEQPEDVGYIPEEKLVGRYVYTSITVEVKEVTLDAIEINGGMIKLDLFKTKAFSAADLGITLKASNGSNTYFAALLDDLIITSKNKELKVEKDTKAKVWNFTVLQYPSSGLTIEVTLPNSSLSVTTSAFDVNLDNVKALNFEGTSKSDTNKTYNDQVLKNITKYGETITTVYNNTIWEWENNTEIVPENGKTSTSYFEVKLFAVGVYHYGAQYKEGTFTNEQGQEIIGLSNVTFTNFGREVRGNNLTDPSVVQALARGTIVLRACVIKTDIDGNPVDLDGNIIKFDEYGNVVDENGEIKTTDMPTFFSIAQSQLVLFKVVENLVEIEGYIEGLPEYDGSAENTAIGQKHVAVSCGSGVTIKLEGNSNGALFDAYNNTTAKGAWLRATTNAQDENTVNPTLTAVEGEGGLQKYYLNIEFNASNLSTEYIEQGVQLMYYTGTSKTSDGYENLELFQFYVIEVPVEQIKINTNVAPTEYTESGEPVYKLAGIINYNQQIINGKSEVTSLSVDWGTLDNEGNLTKFEIYKPTLTAGEVQILKDKVAGKDYILPTPLQISNVSFEQDVTSETAAYGAIIPYTQDGETEKIGDIKIKELGKEFDIVCASLKNGSATVTDTIHISGTLAGSGAVSLAWNTNTEVESEDDAYTLTVSSALLQNVNDEGGLKLRAQDLFGLKLVGSGVQSQDVHISSTSKFLSFEVPSEYTTFVDKTSDDRLVYRSVAFSKTTTIELNVILTTENGLNIRQKYKIKFTV